MKQRKILISLAFLCSTASLTFAQTGPGGIGSTDGNSDLVLWLDANDVSGVYDQNNVANWNDLSGHGHNASQSNSSIKPNISLNAINGNQALQFDGIGDRLTGTFSNNLVAPATIFAAVFFNQINQGASDNDYVFSVGSSSGNGRMSNIARRQNDANANQFYSRDGSTNRFGPVLTGQQWMILNQNHSTTSTFHSVSQNGTALIVDDYTTALSTNTDFRIGDWADSPNNSFLLEGQVGEIIVLDRLLNSAETNIINNYLAAKFDLNTANERYVGDNVANGNFDYQLGGVGTEADGSNSSAASAGLTVNQSSNFGNGDYLLFAHQNTANVPNTVDASDAGGTLEARWERIWYFDVTDIGSTAQVDLEFDFFEESIGNGPEGTTSNYKLLFRASNSGNWTILATADQKIGSVLYFNDVAIANDGYYTTGTIDEANSRIGITRLETSSRGPGGVGNIDGSTNLQLWLNANDLGGSTGDPVVGWTDLSGSNNDLSNGGALNIPEVAANIVNNTEVVRFDGNDDYMNGTLGNLDAPATVFGASYYASLNQGNNDNDYVTSIGTTGTSNQHASLSRRRNNAPADADKFYSWDGNTTRFGPVISGQTWQLFTQEFNSDSPFYQLHIDGTSTATADYSAALNTDGLLQVGRWQGGGNYLNGDISEIIIYNRNLNSAELNIVHSYLGAKLDLAVASDQYTGDDVGNGDFDLNVAGIGTEADGSNNTGSAAGLSMEIDNGFGPGDYVLFGHNVEDNISTNLDAADAGGTLESRFSRVWFVDVTDAGVPAQTNVIFDFSEAGQVGFPATPTSNYRLLFRAVNSGFWTFLASSDAINGDQVRFNGISLTTDGYYTLGSVDSVGGPLPVTWIDFIAEKECSDFDTDCAVKLDWSVATEINLNLYEIQRLKDGEINTVGSINPSKTGLRHGYHFEDKNPVNGESYYRIQNVDFDGNTSTTSWQRIVIESSEIAQVVVYPNPADKAIYIQSHQSYVGHKWRLLSVTGNVAAEGILLPNLTIKVSELNAGIYFLEMEGIEKVKVVVE